MADLSPGYTVQLRIRYITRKNPHLLIPVLAKKTQAYLLKLNNILCHSAPIRNAVCLPVLWELMQRFLITDKICHCENISTIINKSSPTRYVAENMCTAIE